MSLFRIVVILDSLSGHNGTSKLAIKLFEALRALKHDVSVLALRKTIDWKNLLSELKDAKPEFVGSRISDFISFLIEAPLIKLRMKGSFDLDDRVNIFGLLFNRTLKNKLYGADIVIFMNIWASFSLLLLSGCRIRYTVTYFHESYSPFPWPYKTVLDALLKKTVRNSSTLISVTEETRKALLYENNIVTFTLEQAVDLKEVVHNKDDYILADTRWTKERNPFFLIEIAKFLPNFKIIMCGKFGSEELKSNFTKSIIDNRLDNQIVIQNNLEEDELNSLYKHAFCYVRWGGLVPHGEKLAERGPSFGVYQAISNGCIPIISNNLGSAEVIKMQISQEIVVPLVAFNFAQIILKLFNEREFFDEIFGRLLKFRKNNTWEKYAKRLLNIVKTQKGINYAEDN